MSSTGLAAAHEAAKYHLSILGSSTIKIDLDRETMVTSSGMRAVPVIGFVFVTEEQARSFTVPTVQGV